MSRSDQPAAHRAGPARAGRGPVGAQQPLPTELPPIPPLSVDRALVFAVSLALANAQVACQGPASPVLDWSAATRSGPASRPRQPSGCLLWPLASGRPSPPRRPHGVSRCEGRQEAACPRFTWQMAPAGLEPHGPVFLSHLSCSVGVRTELWGQPGLSWRGHTAVSSPGQASSALTGSAGWGVEPGVGRASVGDSHAQGRRHNARVRNNTRTDSASRRHHCKPTLPRSARLRVTVRSMEGGCQVPEVWGRLKG